MKKFALPLWLCIQSFSVMAQVNGGEHMFEFLRLSSAPHITALGGMSISNPSADVMMSTANPALLRPEFHTTLGIVQNNYYAGTKVNNAYYAHHSRALQTTFGFGVQYFNYGTFTISDVNGTKQGDTRANDYSLQLSASRSYLTRWRYGMTLRFAHSNLIEKKASGILFDLGVIYADTSNRIYIASCVRNAGIAIKNYTPGITQPMPIDLQIGITKRFKKAPFSLQALAHHLYEWDIRYNNPADQTNNQLLLGDTSTTNKSYFADKLFRHFIFAAELNLGKRVEISMGYNHMRRAELAISEKKGMSGFSYGAGLYLNKFTLHFARSYYHISGPYNELGLSIQLNQLIGSGGIAWTTHYASAYR
ncbi:MAG: type secretion system protein PorQ [Bacteroidota bacterium]